MGDVLFSAGVQVGIGTGRSANVGPIWTNANIAEYEEIQYHVGLTASDDVVLALLTEEAAGAGAVLGFEGDYAWAGGDYPEGERPSSFFLGVAGTGEEADAWWGTEVIDLHVFSAAPLSGLPRTGEGRIRLLGTTLVESDFYRWIARLVEGR